MFSKILSEKVASFYAEHASDKKTLDVGSRSGRHKEHFPNVFSIDLSAANNPDQVADAHELPFKDNSYEIVICREVLEHVKDPKKVLSELHRVLVPGGVLLLSTRFIFPIHEAPDDRWRFTKYILQELLSDFSEFQVTEDTTPMMSIGILLQRMAWQTKFKFFNKLIKFILLCLAEIFFRLDFLVEHQYGDVTGKNVEKIAFCNGYFVRAVK